MVMSEPEYRHDVAHQVQSGERSVRKRSDGGNWEGCWRGLAQAMGVGVRRVEACLARGSSCSRGSGRFNDSRGACRTGLCECRMEERNDGSRQSLVVADGLPVAGDGSAWLLGVDAVVFRPWRNRGSARWMRLTHAHAHCTWEETDTSWASSLCVSLSHYMASWDKRSASSSYHGHNDRNAHMSVIVPRLSRSGAE